MAAPLLGIACVAVGCAAASIPGPAAAQGAATQPYPSRVVRFIVPFAPAGGTDILARGLAERIRLDLQRWAKVIRAGNIRPE